MPKWISMILVIVLFLTGCLPFMTDTPAKNENLKPTIFESGNWSYITFDNLGYGAPSERTAEIADAIKQWEESHPDRKIVSLQLIYGLRSNNFNPTVDGISIYSLQDSK